MSFWEKALGFGNQNPCRGLKVPIWVFFLCPNTFIWSVLKEPLLVFFKNVSQFLPNPQFRSIQVKREKNSNSRFLIWHLWSPAWNLIFFCAQIPSFGVGWMSHYWTYSRFRILHFPFLKFRVVWFKKKLRSESKTGSPKNMPYGGKISTWDIS